MDGADKVRRHLTVPVAPALRWWLAGALVLGVAGLLQRVAELVDDGGAPVSWMLSLGLLAMVAILGRSTLASFRAQARGASAVPSSAEDR
ncbi:MAG: hypothetical protein R2701_02545 [Acidimicrobiales bacterium]|nr:hypothetical protein [Acidimicrobiales bacterium]